LARTARPELVPLLDALEEHVSASAPTLAQLHQIGGPTAVDRAAYVQAARLELIELIRRWIEDGLPARKGG
jgi:hypothetical protein